MDKGENGHRLNCCIIKEMFMFSVFFEGRYVLWGQCLRFKKCWKIWEVCKNLWKCIKNCEIGIKILTSFGILRPLKLATLIFLYRPNWKYGGFADMERGDAVCVFRNGQASRRNRFLSRTKHLSKDEFNSWVVLGHKSQA